MATEVDVAEEHAAACMDAAAHLLSAQHAADSATLTIAEERAAAGREAVAQPVAAQQAPECPELDRAQSEPMPDAAPLDPDQSACLQPMEAPLAWHTDAEAYEYDSTPAPSPTRQAPWRRLPEPDFRGPARSGPLDVSQHALGASQSPYLGFRSSRLRGMRPAHVRGSLCGNLVSLMMHAGC